ncbi:PQQ-binding-like beta-propeller repeat protein [Actinomadura fulvescens]|uniref:outer membrane protein assembly factor BamB family protein n=1 Tax=Actinomadura fulvescens TaxID=46160 RepID=UPI0031D2CBCB
MGNQLYRRTAQLATVIAVLGAIGCQSVPGKPDKPIEPWGTAPIWSVRIDAKNSWINFRSSPKIVDGRLIYLDDSLPIVHARALKDGKLIWSYRMQDVMIDGLQVEGEKVVVTSVVNQQPVSLDLATGLPLADAAGPSDSPAINVDGVRVTNSSDAIQGTSVTSGQVVWKRGVPSNCRLVDSDLSTHGVGLLSNCSSPVTRLEVLDPKTGRLRWDAQLDTPSSLEDAPIEVDMRSRLTIVHTSYFLAVFNHKGEEIWKREGKGVCTCQFSEEGETVAIGVFLPPPSGKSLIVGLDAVEGKMLWEKRGAGSAIVGSPTAFYALTSIPGEHHLPAFAYRIEKRSGKTILMSLPFAHRGMYWLGYKDGIMYALTADGPTDLKRLTAYRLIPSSGVPQLGGVRPDSWPDACSLISINHLRAKLGDSYRAQPRVTDLPDIRFPKPVSCDYLPYRESSPALRVTVAWSSRDVDSSLRLLSSRTSVHDFKQLAGIGDEAFALLDRDQELSTAGIVLLRVGRHIVQVEAVADSRRIEDRSARQVAEQVALTLAGK